MRKPLLGLGWLAAGTLLIAGCQSTAGYPKGPLLASKAPVKGTVDGAAPVQVADAEPQAPPLPAEALANGGIDHERAATIGYPTGSVLRPSAPTTPQAAPAPASPFITAERTRGPVQAIPAVRTQESATGTAVPATPAMRSGAASGTVMSGIYGHDADYTWLQGMVEKHYHGRLYLRYCDPSVEDTHGGKVCLDHSPDLEQFHDGDIIRVEGTLNTEHDPSRHAGWQHFPHYHVKSARLIERHP
jgi:hypothetical protein